MRQNSRKNITRLSNVTILLLTLFPFAAFAQAPAPASVKTALDKYVEAPDPTYKYELVSKTQGAGYTTFVLKMTSQTWRSTAEVDRNVWWHWMIIVKPDEVKSSKSLLYIAGGNNNSSAPKEADQSLVQLAMATKSVATGLHMVPNQPLTFSDDKKPRVEDEFIAYTWDKFLKTGDELWPARLPMTKAAVRAMDTVISFCGGEEGGKTKIDGFEIGRASCRERGE